MKYSDTIPLVCEEGWLIMSRAQTTAQTLSFSLILPPPPPSYFTCLCTCEKLSGEYFLKITTSACVVFSAVPEIGACSLYTTINGDRCKVTALGARVMRSECSFNGRFERESRIS